jgi:hypothetical protein
MTLSRFLKRFRIGGLRILIVSLELHRSSPNVTNYLSVGNLPGSPNTAPKERFHRVDWQPGVMDLTTRFGGIDQWLKDCCQNHRSCNKIKMPGYPRRLLDITVVEKPENGKSSPASNATLLANHRHIRLVNLYPCHIWAVYWS